MFDTSYLSQILKFALEECKDAAPKDSRIAAEVKLDPDLGVVDGHTAVDVNIIITPTAPWRVLKSVTILLGVFVVDENEPGEDWLRTTFYQKAVEELFKDLSLEMMEGRDVEILRHMVEDLERKHRGFLNPAIVMDIEDINSDTELEGNRFEFHLPPKKLNKPPNSL